MSEQQTDEAAAEPTDTASDSSEESSGSGDTGTSDTGSDANGSDEAGGSDTDSGDPGGVSDAELPEDLQATEDNPLARHPRQTGDENDQIGADSETGDAANPSASMTYGEDDDSDESSSNTGDDDAGS
jgi:hypothetical protein